MAQLRYIPNVVTLQLDQNKCTGCGMCAEVCPHGVFVLEFGDSRLCPVRTPGNHEEAGSEFGTDTEIRPGPGPVGANGPAGPCGGMLTAAWSTDFGVSPRIPNLRGTQPSVSPRIPRNPKAEIVDLDACMECGACARNCPAEAISVRAGVGCAVAVMNAARRKGEPGCGCSEQSRCSEQSGCCN